MANNDERSAESYRIVQVAIHAVFLLILVSSLLACGRQSRDADFDDLRIVDQEGDECWWLNHFPDTVLAMGQHGRDWIQNKDSCMLRLLDSVASAYSKEGHGRFSRAMGWFGENADGYLSEALSAILFEHLAAENGYEFLSLIATDSDSIRQSLLPNIVWGGKVEIEIGTRFDSIQAWTLIEDTEQRLTAMNKLDSSRAFLDTLKCGWGLTDCDVSYTPGH